jgi:hypothetical protein
MECPIKFRPHLDNSSSLSRDRVKRGSSLRGFGSPGTERPPLSTHSQATASEPQASGPSSGKPRLSRMPGRPPARQPRSARRVSAVRPAHRTRQRPDPNPPFTDPNQRRSRPRPAPTKPGRVAVDRRSRILPTPASPPSHGARAKQSEPNQPPSSARGRRWRRRRRGKARPRRLQNEPNLAPAPPSQNEPNFASLRPCKTNPISRPRPLRETLAAQAPGEGPSPLRDQNAKRSQFPPGVPPHRAPP